MQEKKGKLRDGIINPFTEKFLEIWELWKTSRVEEWGNTGLYRGVISEQSALNDLVLLSGGEEEKAIAIVKQSMSAPWKNFYPLKRPTNGKQYSTNPKEAGTSSNLRERVQRAVNKKFGGG